MAIDYNVFYTQKRGAAYRDEQVKSYSHYKEAVDHSPGRLAGKSRIWGDASLEVQKAVIDKLIAAGKGAGMNVRRVAMLLAMVKIESGFNPDAAAGTTSASGLGQFINDTGRAYGLNNSNRFDVNASVKAVVKYFLANEKLATKNKKPDVWVYKYHHDGPTLDYGGEALATGKFAKLADAYEKALEVGHALSVIDAGGAPIAQATIKVEQNGKSAVMKTNEHGLLPTFMASPDFGPLTIYIQKASDDFKELGQLAIDKLNSAWTIVAPKERIPVKTHVHVDKAAPAKTPGMHKVAKGETLSSIARAHGTTYQELAKLNNIDKPYLLFPNQMLKVPEGKGKPAPAAASKPASAPAQETAKKEPAQAAAAKPTTPPATAAGTKPVVKEDRSAKTTHPEATISKPPASNRVATAIAYAMQHKEPKSIGRCLRYVKRALVAAGYFTKYPGVEHAKDFGPTLQSAGFKNLLVSAPGTNISTAPHGSIIIYAPVEKQTYSGGVISGHIEIKHAGGYVSDFNGHNPCYRTDAISLKSPLSKKYGITFKATGIWYKE
ncbi:Murein DD-endopeptidase MepM and murein hydrolase activator NlpD, contain LysM domain [Duganella sp. CF458]|uniref:LysM peptidoglycan-binding domain-containing protein n=1 Tax=Duganella sp. CF458 TaxID=1884368 RepID=UPI0008F09D47|nr:LysM peptidoglycan-binding domain-containing protein [Duganella sp. CF458]SFG74762.1 Murein DD-endopeptidase MepM and murein hydrolase activator NlpD, contain LysM domain [Duganella sp. CF458]